MNVIESVLPPAFRVVQLILFIGLAIFVHECGHFIAARLAGIRVLEFMVGLPPRFLRVVRRGARWTWSWFPRGGDEGDAQARRHTWYTLSLIPFGGLVRLAGEDWSEDKPPKPRDLMAKPAWVRIIVYSAGVTMNIALAYVIFAAVLLRGVDVPTYPAVLAAVPAGSPAAAAGLLRGDRIERVGEKVVANWDEAVEELYRGLEAEGAPDRPVAVRVRRGEAEVAAALVMSRTREAGLAPRIPAVIGSTAPFSPARKAGILAGDRVVEVNGRAIGEWSDVARLIGGSKTGPVRLTIARRGTVGRPTLVIEPKPDPLSGRRVIGISPAAPLTVTRRFGTLESLRLAGRTVQTLVVEIVRTVAQVVTGTKRFQDVLGGPVMIARLGYEKASEGIWDLLHYMAVLNVHLAVANLIPIPVLDGGMIVLAAFEGARRKRLAVSTYQALNTVGLALIVLLALVATYHDFLR